MVNPKEYITRVRMENLGHNVPRADARWIGQLLSRLSSAQSAPGRGASAR